MCCQGAFCYLSRSEGLREGGSWCGPQRLEEKYAWGERELAGADSKGGVGDGSEKVIHLCALGSYLNQVQKEDGEQVA